jgi:hypothetical protein
LPRVVFWFFRSRLRNCLQRKTTASEPPKPFSNFPIFHDRLLERLKGINQLHMSFERRTKELEERFVDQLQ